MYIIFHHNKSQFKSRFKNICQEYTTLLFIFAIAAQLVGNIFTEQGSMKRSD